MHVFQCEEYHSVDFVIKFKEQEQKVLGKRNSCKNCSTVTKYFSFVTLATCVKSGACDLLPARFERY